MLSKDNRVQLCGRSDSGLVGHETLGDGVHRVENGDLTDSGGGRAENTGGSALFFVGWWGHGAKEKDKEEDEKFPDD